MKRNSVEGQKLNGLINQNSSIATLGRELLNGIRGFELEIKYPWLYEFSLRVKETITDVSLKQFHITVIVNA